MVAAVVHVSTPRHKLWQGVSRGGELPRSAALGVDGKPGNGVKPPRLGAGNCNRYMLLPCSI